MSVHIFRGYAATDTPGFLADTTGYLPGDYDERRAQDEMKRLPTRPCPRCWNSSGWLTVRERRCPRCNGFGVVIVGRPSAERVTRAVLVDAEQGEP